MNAERPGPTDGLSVVLSAPVGTGPEVRGPSRFAAALKRARFAKGWTQAALAAQINIPKRSIVSWETAERIPGIGMVVLLLDALSSEEELSLHRELMTAYIADDLERQQGRAGQQEAPFLQRARRLRERVLQLSARPGPAARPEHRVDAAPSDAPEREERLPQPPQAGDRAALEPLFAMLSRLQRHPELIPVAGDFIRELASED